MNKALIRMIRWPNLLIMALSMYLMYVPVIQHLLGPEASALGMSTLNFILLLAATLLIAAGGYIINDIADVTADQTNKPGKNAIGSLISVSRAQLLYYIISLAGIAAGSVLSFQVHTPVLALLFVFTAGLLWFYAKDYQCRPLLGNMVIGVLSALSFGLVFMFEVLALRNHNVPVTMQHYAFEMALKITLIYMAFAFLTSLIREIVKDVEDATGDHRVGCRTFAVVYGQKKAGNLALGATLLGLAGAFIIQWFFYKHGMVLLFFYFFLVDLLFSMVAYKLLRATGKKDFSSLSLWTKLLMLTGVLSMALFYFGG
ncbi:MAG: geranylgeranylglycerol-phosphate geranylgeranyltransferase [Bacteroidales bacterium]|nr:geranylgeranylglycerol-phosphate geranylgeranyltransferase [Bacteroidales bacterium]